MPLLQNTNGPPPLPMAGEALRIVSPSGAIAPEASIAGIDQTPPVALLAFDLQFPPAVAGEAGCRGRVAAVHV